MTYNIIAGHNNGPDPFATDARIQKINSSEDAVRQYAAERRATGQARNTQRDQGDAGHARYRDHNSGKLGAQQQPPSERRNNNHRRAGAGFTDGRENKQLFQNAAMR